ncbi:hypothetical protein BDZ45DRAFT_799544 [Acephala macrosclerotiorum]|nr:hypothetical protein BDZ45DRAFT_799544 [Acephala macrosclerotiorum]
MDDDHLSAPKIRLKSKETPKLFRLLENLLISSPAEKSQPAQQIEPKIKMASKEFLPFQRMPDLLRKRVWGFALINDKSTEIRVIAPALTKERAQFVARGREYGGLKPNNHGYAPGQPALVWVNQEARAVAMAEWEDREHYQSYTYRFVNFETDTFDFHFDEFGCEESFLVEIWDGKKFPKAYLNISEEDIGKMRKIVIGFYEEEVKTIGPWVGYFIEKWLQFFTSLEEIKVEVYPDTVKDTKLPPLVSTSFDDMTLQQKVNNVVSLNRPKWQNKMNARKDKHEEKYGEDKAWPTPLFTIVETGSGVQCLSSHF